MNANFVSIFSTLHAQWQHIARALPTLWFWPLTGMTLALLTGTASWPLLLMGLAWCAQIHVLHLRPGDPDGKARRCTAVDSSFDATQNSAVALRALIVDDHPINLLLTHDLLAQIGVQATTAESGARALQIAEENHFDIVFLDVQMPEMDGMQLCNSLHELWGAQCPPIIALTAHAFAHERTRFLDAGMDECLTKPVSGSHLASCIGRWLLNEPFESKSECAPHAATLRRNSCAIDRETCLRMAGGKPDLARQLIAALVETLPANVAAIHAAAHQQDAIEMRAQLHRLLGACRYAGVPGLLQETQKLHEECLQRRLPAQVSTLFRETSQVLDAAYNWLASSPPDSSTTNAIA